jgi:hypothetical protein
MPSQRRTIFLLGCWLLTVLLISSAAARCGGTMVGPTALPSRGVNAKGVPEAALTSSLEVSRTYSARPLAAFAAESTLGFATVQGL